MSSESLSPVVDAALLSLDDVLSLTLSSDSQAGRNKSSFHLLLLVLAAGVNELAPVPPLSRRALAQRPLVSPLLEPRHVPEAARRRMARRDGPAEGRVLRRRAFEVAE